MKTASFFLVGIVSVLLATSEARSQSIILNETFIGDTTVFPFNGNATIYGITMSGSFHLNSDSSLVRVLVTGNNGECS